MRERMADRGVVLLMATKATSRAEGRPRQVWISAEREWVRTQSRINLPPNLIRVNEAAKRKGQCRFTALLHHVLAEAKELGARRATLEVRASNAQARRLYERLGFYVAGTRRNYYTNPVEDALILWRDDPNSAGPPVQTG